MSAVSMKLSPWSIDQCTMPRAVRASTGVPKVMVPRQIGGTRSCVCGMDLGFSWSIMARAPGAPDRRGSLDCHQRLEQRPEPALDLARHTRGLSGQELGPDIGEAVPAAGKAGHAVDARRRVEQTEQRQLVGCEALQPAPPVRDPGSGERREDLPELGVEPLLMLRRRA